MSLSFGASAAENFRKIHAQQPLLKKKEVMAKKMKKIDWSKANDLRARPNPEYFKK